MTPADFKTRFPEFAGESDARVQLFITDAIPLFDVSRWGDLYEAGVASFVAHELSLANAQTLASGQAAVLAGDEISTSVGDVSLTRDAQLAREQVADPYLRTSYGQKYRRLVRLVGTGGVAL